MGVTARGSGRGSGRGRGRGRDRERGEGGGIDAVSNTKAIMHKRQRICLIWTSIILRVCTSGSTACMERGDSGGAGWGGVGCDVVWCGGTSVGWGGVGRGGVGCDVVCGVAGWGVTRRRSSRPRGRTCSADTRARAHTHTHTHTTTRSRTRARTHTGSRQLGTEEKKRRNLKGL